MPPKRPPDAAHQKGLFRFRIIADLLARPPAPGELASRLRELAGQTFAHPLSQTDVKVSVRTLERWYAAARDHDRPNEVLQPKLRSDRGLRRSLNELQMAWLLSNKREHPDWDVQLLVDNLHHSNVEGIQPSYSTVLRYLKSQGFFASRGRRKARREVRSFEVEHVGELWHMDFHHGSRMVVDERGEYQQPICMAIIDDKSRLVCHMQWFLNETTEVLVHGLIQAIQKRGLPRGFYTDNGSAMRAEELKEGLERLGILAQRTLPYAAYQNGKQECFWKPLEGRMMRMFPKHKRITLEILNHVSQAWAEQDYQVRVHRETGMTPLDRFMNSPDVLRPSPSMEALKRSFRITCTRKQRRTDGTVTLDGVRFQVPRQYAHLEELTLRYARWDLGEAEILCPETRLPLVSIAPLDRLANANGLRKDLHQEPETSTEVVAEGDILDLENDAIPPFMRHLLDEHRRHNPLVGYLPCPQTKGAKKP